jgi:hypothetical protein
VSHRTGFARRPGFASRRLRSRGACKSHVLFSVDLPIVWDAHTRSRRRSADLQADRVYEVGGWGEGALTARALPPARAFGSPWPLSACRPGGSLLSGSSVAPVYRFLLMLRNGEAADPPAFLTEQPYWKPGDVFVAANGRAFRVVEIDAEVEVAGMVLFDSIWTIEPFEE